MCLVILDTGHPGIFLYVQVSLEGALSYGKQKQSNTVFCGRVEWYFLKTALSEMGKHLSKNNFLCQILYLFFNIFLKAGWEICGQFLLALVLSNFLSKNLIHFSPVSCLQT